MLESEPGAARWVEESLHEAGHQTVRCHELGLPAFPCNGLIDECREGAPVLAAGRTALNPFAPWLAADIGVEDVLAAVERLGSEPLR